MQETFGFNMLALVDNEPKILNLKEMLTHYLAHQEDVVTRRTKYDLKKAEERAHILEGLLKALDVIEEVIALIRASKNVAEAKTGLMEKFAFTEVQAQAIVDMRLRALTGLEREKLVKELEELHALITRLKAILADEKLLLGVIREELTVIREKYQDPRRTVITYDEGEINLEDLIKDELAAITMTHLGYIKRMPISVYKNQHRGGKGMKGVSTREEDFVEDIFIAATHSYLFFFTNKGKVYRLKTYEVPESSRTARGTALVNLLQLGPDEKITAVVPIREYKEDNYLVMATKKGMLKKTSLDEYANIRSNGLQAINLREDDDLIEVKLTDGQAEIFLGTKMGQHIRSVGRNSIGVRGMSLNPEDEVIGMQLLSQGKYILTVSEKGLGKRTDMAEFTLQNRGGKGLKFYKITEKTGCVIGMKAVDEDNELILITNEGIVIRINVSDISELSRITSGVKLMDLDAGIFIAGIARLKALEEISEEIEESEEVLESDEDFDDVSEADDDWEEDLEDADEDLEE